MGEILQNDDFDAYLATNSKRVDLIVVDAFGNAVAAIEYQGFGHAIGETSRLRDDINRQALESAGIGYLEVFPRPTRMLSSRRSSRACATPRRSAAFPKRIEDRKEPPPQADAPRKITRSLFCSVSPERLKFAALARSAAPFTQ